MHLKVPRNERTYFKEIFHNSLKTKRNKKCLFLGENKQVEKNEDFLKIQSRWMHTTKKIKISNTCLRITIRMLQFKTYKYEELYEDFWPPQSDYQRIIHGRTELISSSFLPCLCSAIGHRGLYPPHIKAAKSWESELERTWGARIANFSTSTINATIGNFLAAHQFPGISRNKFLK